MVFDSDDFGANHVISDMCQSHDCRDVLDKLHKANPKFKATLFSIPGEITPELLRWSEDNLGWIELAYHGAFHTSNYECEKMTYDEFDNHMKYWEFIKYDSLFQRGFKAPGWQISDGIYKWLLDNDFWVADQYYNNDRRPKELPAYINKDGEFGTMLLEKNGINYFHTVSAIHTHTWNCVGNGVYELFDDVLEKVKNTDEFKFVSEVVK